MSDRKFDAKQWYLSNFDIFESSLNGSKNEPFHDIRKRAIARFADLGFPTTRHEEWKYTSIAPILEHKFNLSTKPVAITETTLQRFLYEGSAKNILVFVNGHFDKKLSRVENKTKGLVIDNFKNVLSNGSKLPEKYHAGFERMDDETFSSLNTAFVNDGLYIHVPKGTIIEDPIVLLYLSDSQKDPFVAHPRNLIVAEEGSHLRLLECYHAISETAYFNNVVTEVFVEHQAVVDHIKIQEEGWQAFHIAKTQITQERRSVFNSVNIDLGGALIRNNLNVRLNAENCETHLFGFFLGTGTQLIDNHTFIDHAKPHCFSNELYKGILDDKSRGVFNGKIMVRPDAQKTNALQSNKTLLLTDDAAIFAKPQLEIFADDVKCTHGATIGQLDDEALFYLRARGIGENVALAMLRYAFAGDIFENIKINSVRKALAEKVFERLK